MSLNHNPQSHCMTLMSSPPVVGTINDASVPSYPKVIPGPPSPIGISGPAIPGLPIPGPARTAFHHSHPRTTLPRTTLPRTSHLRTTHPRTTLPRTSHPRTSHLRTTHPRTTLPRTSHPRTRHLRTTHPRTSHCWHHSRTALPYTT
ncbi:hypothetical protein CALCODRAFT_180947 [Calocera cornea HHB12733]|uniref:Uncharacterized protein n=1 Tax=Calocera cornea HHB12733 TaxID=1353952 RepID=A0A165HQW3_9BASI|nr:hypothetical protein CALCODRAFT_180947 [Calocera cornea HHB12733]